MLRELSPRRLARTLAALLAGLIAVALLAVPSAAAGHDHSAPASRPASAVAASVAIGQPAPFGDAPALGSTAGRPLSSPIVGMAAAPDGRGYWLVAADGGIFSYGSAHFYGSAGALHLASPIVGMAAAPDGRGYWLVAADGGIFSYGSAHFYGSAGALHLVSPIVGMAVAPGGRGYWLAAADGGVFAYGAASFYGSAASLHLDSPVVGIAAPQRSAGYWLVTAAGGVYTYGEATFHGSAGALHLPSPVVGMAASLDGGGYWLATAGGGVYAFGAVQFHGVIAGLSLSAAKARVWAIASDPSGDGYWLLPTALPPPPPPPPPPPTVGPGETSQAVAMLQEKLSALGYWVGTTDGDFDDSTEQAVWALQKAAGLDPDGVVGPSTWAALDHHVLPRPRSTSGYVIEVDLADDLVMFVTSGKIDHVLNTSTGGGYTYTEDGVTSVADTPTGHFDIYTAVNGLVTDSLGQLWRPRYFDAGFAIHGDGYVPPFPVSHGCVRVSNEAIDWIWADNLAPIGTEVWVYG